MSITKRMLSTIKITNILVGIVFLVLACVAIINIELATYSILIIFGVSLIILGLVRIFVGLYYKEEEKTTRILKVSFGSIFIIIGIIILSVPSLGVDLLIILLASALIANGLIRVIISIIEKNTPNWFRILFGLIGSITIFLGVITLIFTKYGYFTLIILISIIFIMNGIARIMYYLVIGT